LGSVFSFLLICSLSCAAVHRRVVTEEIAQLRTLAPVPRIGKDSTAEPHTAPRNVSMTAVVSPRTHAGARRNGQAMIVRNQLFYKDGWFLTPTTTTPSRSGEKKTGLSTFECVQWFVASVRLSCCLCNERPRYASRIVPCDWHRWCEEINGFDCAQVLRESVVVEMPNGPELRWRSGWVCNPRKRFCA